MLLIAPLGYGGGTKDHHSALQGGHSTLNTVVLGEGVSKSKYTTYFGHHSRAACTDARSDSTIIIFFEHPVREKRPCKSVLGGEAEFQDS